MPPKKKVKKAAPTKPIKKTKDERVILGDEMYVLGSPSQPCSTCVNRIEFTVTFKPGTYGNSVEKVNRCWLTDIDVDAIESIECNQWRGK